MAAPISNRKLRVHKKSKQGCGNCKLRSVKCDERKPECSKCLSYGLLCDYNRPGTDLQLSMERVQLPPSLSYWPDRNAELFDKFQIRTAPTMTAGKRLELYQNSIIGLTNLVRSPNCALCATDSQNPHLKHAILAVTLTHDRHMAATFTPKPSTEETFHYYNAARDLKAQIRTGNRAALVTTAALLGTAVFSHFEAMTPEEAWPLKDSTSDLNWLVMSRGKQEVWRLAPPGDDSAFEIMACQQSVSADLSMLPSEYYSLFELYNAAGNPYYAAAMCLARAVNADLGGSLFAFVTFISTVDPDLKHLLGIKDRRALILLERWYHILARFPVWWLQRRAKIEGEAIRAFLQGQV